MVNKIKITTFILTITMFLMTLTSCAAPTNKELAGVYGGSHIYNDNNVTVTILLDENGSYEKAVYKNEIAEPTETGTYEIDGNKVICYAIKTYKIDEGEVKWTEIKSKYRTVYTYSKNKLENNGYTYEKVED